MQLCPIAAAVPAWMPARNSHAALSYCFLLLLLLHWSSLQAAVNVLGPPAGHCSSCLLAVAVLRPLVMCIALASGAIQ